MSVLQKLTEGIVHRDVSKEGAAMLTKWEQTGLLEGITDDRTKNSMAVLLENQAKELLREASGMAAGDVEGFASVAFPIVRRVFGGLIANDIVSVQPMSLPSGLIFFLDFTKSTDLGGNPGSGREESVYGGNLAKLRAQDTAGDPAIGRDIIDGVDISGDPGGFYNLTGEHSSPRGAARLSFEEVFDDTPAVAQQVGNEGIMRTLRHDPDVLSAARIHILRTAGQASDIVINADGLIGAPARDGSSVNLDLLRDLAVANAGAGLAQNAVDASNVATSNGGGMATIDLAEGAAVRTLQKRLTHVDSQGRLVLVLISAADDANAGALTVAAAGADRTGETVLDVSRLPLKDTFGLAGQPAGLGAIAGGAQWGLEGNASIPEIDIKVDSIAVTAVTKKLKAKWTPELAQDLNAYHSLDAEVELTGILSEQIALEIDQEILGDLVDGATAGTLYWSRRPGKFLDRASGADISDAASPPDFTGTVSEWYETLVETINDVSAQIHRKTLRGGANFIVCSPEVANILEFTSGFRASVTADQDRGSVGAVKVGSVSKKFDVMVDPYFPRNVILVGRKGSSFLESGYVYAPYVPLQTTPTIFGPEDFVPRKGVMTRYAKQMVRPDMYGLVVCQDLVG